MKCKGTNAAQLGELPLNSRKLPHITIQAILIYRVFWNGASQGYSIVLWRKLEYRFISVGNVTRLGPVFWWRPHPLYAKQAANYHRYCSPMMFEKKLNLVTQSYTLGRSLHIKEADRGDLISLNGLSVCPSRNQGLEQLNRLHLFTRSREFTAMNRRAVGPRG